MRKTLLFLALALAAAGPVLAQSNRGAFGLDAMVAPTTSFGFGYYITDGLSLRPARLRSRPNSRRCDSR